MWHVSQKPLFPGCDEYKKSYPVADQSPLPLPQKRYPRGMKCTDRPHDTVNGKNMEQERISWLFNCWCKFRRRCQQFDVHIAVEKTTTDDGSGFPFTFFPLSFPSFAQISPERTSSLAMGLRLLLALAPLAALVVGQVGIVIRGSVKVTGRIIFNLRFRWPLLVAVARFAICKRDRVWKGWSSKMRCSFLFITVWSQLVYQANVILMCYWYSFVYFPLFHRLCFEHQPAFGAWTATILVSFLVLDVWNTLCSSEQQW